MKSIAPAFIAWTASGTSPWPVMTTTGRQTCRDFSWRCSSRPSIPGIRTSVTMQPGCKLGIASGRAKPDSYSRTGKPEAVSINANACRTPSSSSIRCTTASSAILLILVSQGLDGQAEDCPAARVRLHPEPSTMRLDYSSGNRQPDPHSMSLGRDEGLKKLIGDLLGYAGSGISDSHFHHFIVRLRCGDRQLPTRRLLHRLDRVTQEVQDNLLDLNLVDQHKRDAGVERKVDADSGFLDPDESKRACLLDQLCEIFRQPLALAA